MSVITLQYGQCGNQIGQSLFSCIYEDLLTSKQDRDYHTSVLSNWFSVTKNGKWQPKSILIDCETKTITDFKNMPFKFKNVHMKSYGSCANNWAYGYSNRSKLLIDGILDSVRLEVEKSELMPSFLNIFSSSGGTGSGVSSYVTESLRKEYPKKIIVNAVVLPYVQGEIAVQSYNSLLTLMKIYSISDATVLFENDRLHYNCFHSLNITDVDFQNINRLISQQLMSLYHPINNENLADLLANLTVNPLFKLLKLQSAPLLINKGLTNNWLSLMNSLLRQSRFDFQQQSNTKTKIPLREKVISAILLSRGCHKPTERETKQFQDSANSVSWLSKNQSLKIYYQKNKIFNADNYLTLISNNNSACVPLSHIYEDASNLLKYGAYVHHYKQYDISEEYFRNSLKKLEDIIVNYKKL